MNKEFREEIAKMKEEVTKLERKLTEIETKYSYINDYRMVAHMLNKLGVERFETTREDMEKCTATYIAAHCEDGKIIVYKTGDKTRE